MHSGLGFMVNNHLTSRTSVFIVNNKSQTMCYSLQPDCSLLLLVNIQASLHCKQGSLYETLFTTSCDMKQNLQLFLIIWKTIPNTHLLL